MNVSYLKRLTSVEKESKFRQLKEMSEVRELGQKEMAEFLYLATPVLDLPKANPAAERDANGNFILKNAVGSAR